MAPNVTSTSLLCHSIRVWHKQLNLTGLCFAKLLLREMIPPPGRTHMNSLRGGTTSLELLPSERQRGTRHRGRVSPQIHLGHLPGSCCCTDLWS